MELEFLVFEIFIFFAAVNYHPTWTHAFYIYITNGFLQDANSGSITQLPHLLKQNLVISNYTIAEEVLNPFF
jgi:hypothetical protein